MSEESGDVVRRERFSGGPARGFLSSMEADRRLFEADLAVDRAHVVMLAEQGIVPDEEAGEILGALDDVERAGYDALPEGEDIHSAIETAVIERVGETGGKMHTARSRNDEVATCLRYRLCEDLLEVLTATLAFREALVETAEAHTETIMPGYTHLQPAQPTTVAHWLCSYEQAVARDTERLLDAYGRVNRCPLGAAAFAGTPFDVDRERTAELLGFDSVVVNSMDASSTRDFLVEVVSALANLATTLSGLAEDLIVFANKGYVELSDDYASTSSIMPQKKNPDTLELVRASAGDASSGVTGLLTTLKGLPRAYNRDLQQATPHAWKTVDQVREATDVAAGAVATAEWNEELLEAAAGEGFSTATGVADALAMQGLPFRTAHELVAIATEHAEQRSAERPVSGEQSDPRDGSDYAALDAASKEVLGEPLAEHVSREAIESALDPESSVASRDSMGGPAPAAVESALASAKKSITADEEAVAELENLLDAAADRREREVRSYA